MNRWWQARMLRRCKRVGHRWESDGVDFYGRVCARCGYAEHVLSVLAIYKGQMRYDPDATHGGFTAIMDDEGGNK